MPSSKLSIKDTTSLTAYKQSEYAFKQASALYRSTAQRWKVAREYLIKKADFGENQNPQFEQAFGSIAFTYLQEKAPGLVPYILGFQLLDRTDGGKKAVGAFVAELGDKMIDIPMFFVNGELKGHQVMRLRNPEMFIPLRESFLDYLFSRMPQDLGDAGPSLGSSSPVQSTPDIQPFAGSRFKGANDASWLHEWAKVAGIAEEYMAIKHNPTNLELGIALLEKTKNAHVDLVELLSHPGNQGLCKTAAALCDAYPNFRDCLDRTLPKDWFVKAAKQAFAKQPIVLRVPRAASTLRLNTKQSVQGGLTFTRNQIAVDFKNLNRGKIASEIDKYGDYASDNRPADKLAEAFEVEAESQVVEPPDEVGVYEVLNADGKRTQMIVIPGHTRSQHASTDLIIDPKKGKFCNVDRNRYMAYPQSAEVNFATTPIDKVLRPMKRRPSEGDIFFVPMKDTIAGPFYCSKRVGVDRFKVDDITDAFLVNASYEGISLPAVETSCSRVNEIIFVDTTRDPSSAGGRYGSFVVSKKQKVYVLGSHLNSDDESRYLPTYSNKVQDKFKLDVYDRAHCKLDDFFKLSNLHVQRRASGDVEINSVPLKLGHARRYLMQTVGLSKSAAESLVNGPLSIRRFIVQPAGTKFSSLADLKKLSYYAPSVEFPTTDEMYSSESGNYQIENPQELYNQAEDEPVREPINPWDDPEGAGNPELSQETQGIMESDPSDTLGDMVGLISLLRNNRIDASIKATTKALLSAIDRLGRQIVTFHAHREEFEELYGEEDASDLESALTATFEQAGDTFITLTRRSNDSNPELDIADLPSM